MSIFEHVVARKAVRSMVTSLAAAGADNPKQAINAAIRELTALRDGEETKVVAQVLNSLEGSDRYYADSRLGFGEGVD